MLKLISDQVCPWGASVGFRSETTEL